MDSALALTCDLVAIESVNPSLVPGAAGESAIASFLAGRLRAAGFDVEVSDALPGRPNVVARATARAAGPTLVLSGHLDTVGPGGHPAPFSPRIEGDRLYGRGAQDMKGGLAALVDAAIRFLGEGGPYRGTLVVAALADEEYGSAGAEAFVASAAGDAAVIAEPTDLAVGVAHKGFSCAEVVVHGRAAHGSRPADGRDAILRMGRVLGALEALDRRLQAGAPHPRLGPASLHASVITGGGELSSYPARSALRMERRTLPGEGVDTATRECAAIVAHLQAADPSFEADVAHLLGRGPYAIPETAPLVRAVQQAARAAGAAGDLCGLSFWTDAAIFGEAGVPTVLFGPGGAGLHGDDEYVRTPDVLVCRDAVLRLLRESGTGAAAPW